jgi:hypothetical protein
VAAPPVSDRETETAGHDERQHERGLGTRVERHAETLPRPGPRGQSGRSKTLRCRQPATPRRRRARPHVIAAGGRGAPRVTRGSLTQTRRRRTSWSPGSSPSTT